MGWLLELVYTVNYPTKKSVTAMHDVTSKV